MTNKRSEGYPCPRGHAYEAGRLDKKAEELKRCDEDGTVVDEEEGEDEGGMREGENGREV